MADATCSIDGCTKSPRKRCTSGPCEMHYYRRRRTGSYEVARTWHRLGVCSVAGCGQREKLRGMCTKHGTRDLRHGDPRIVKTPPGQPMETNPAWRGDEVNYFSWHQRLASMQGRAAEYSCVDCGHQAAHWSYDHAAVDEKIDHRSGLPYTTDPDHYSPRCHRCHMQFDGVTEAASASRRRH